MKTSAYTPFEVGTKDRVVGLFVIGAVLLFLLGFLIPKIQQLTDAGIPFHTSLDQTYGIAPKAAVRLRGVVIGKVTEVRFSDDAVRVDLSLSSTYADFYTVGSRLEVDSEIGINMFLTGSGLILLPGEQDTELLQPDSFMHTDKPKGLGSIIEETAIIEIKNQVTKIIDNVELITSGITENQDKIYRSLDNLEQITADLAEVSKSLPKMTESVDSSLVSLQQTMVGIDKMVAGTNRNLQPLLQEMTQLATEATKTMAETEFLLRAATPVVNQLPTFLVTTEIAIRSLTELTDQMGNSWLFGSSGDPVAPKTTGPYIHPHDDSLYSDVTVTNEK